MDDQHASYAYAPANYFQAAAAPGSPAADRAAAADGYAADDGYVAEDDYAADDGYAVDDSCTAAEDDSNWQAESEQRSQ